MQRATASRVSGGNYAKILDNGAELIVPYSRADKWGAADLIYPCGECEAYHLSPGVEWDTIDPNNERWGCNMDPNRTLQDVNVALIHGFTLDAFYHARDLRTWIDRGGFQPTNMNTYPRAWGYVQSLNMKDEE